MLIFLACLYFRHPSESGCSSIRGTETGQIVHQRGPIWSARSVFPEKGGQASLPRPLPLRMRFGLWLGKKQGNRRSNWWVKLKGHAQLCLCRVHVPQVLKQLGHIQFLSATYASSTSISSCSRASVSKPTPHMGSSAIGFNWEKKVACLYF